MRSFRVRVIVVLLFLLSFLSLPTFASDAKYTQHELNPDFLINQIRKRYLKSSDSPLNPSFFGFYDEPWRFPITAPNSFFVDQGYDGPFSHQNKKALDLSSGHGLVSATRSGRVGVVNFGGKWDQWCNSYNDCFNKGGVWNGNHIIINHPDGSSSFYIHLEPGSLLPGIVEGRDVTIGTPLARIGGTGFTCNLSCSAPYEHLHFQVNNGAGNTIPTPFDDCTVSTNICSNNIPIAGNSYTSINYSSDLNSIPGPIYIFGQSRSVNSSLKVSNNQTNWLFSPLGELKIANLCLTQNGSTLSLVSCQDSNNQKWELTNNSAYQNRSSGQCLSLPNFSLGASLSIANCNGSFLQQFRHSSQPYSLTIFP